MDGGSMDEMVTKWGKYIERDDTSSLLIIFTVSVMTCLMASSQII
jgi:hypothetical protein